jgi:WD40 repeat protein
MGKPNYKSIQVYGADGKVIRNLYGHSEVVKVMSFFPNCKSIASGSADNTLRIWKIFDESSHPIVMQTGERVTKLTISPDGLIIASGGIDNKVFVWSSDGRLLNRLNLPSPGIMDLRFSRNGKTLIASSSDGFIYQWNFDLLELIHNGCSFLRNIPPQTLPACREIHKIPGPASSSLERHI